MKAPIPSRNCRSAWRNLRLKALSTLKNRASSVLKTRISFFISISLLCSCATPSSQYSNLAKEFSFVISTLETERFRHVYYANAAVRDIQPSQALHIYIEGDGTPWIDGKWIAIDPTPRKAVMLELMHMDPSPAILLGRPCYHLESTDNNCNPSDWTMGRYSPTVIASMLDAIDALQQQLGFSEVVIFGHSGGGTIALLLAHSLRDKLQHERIQSRRIIEKQANVKVTALVTLAANIDIDAWTSSNGYLPLDQSINPALLPALPSSIYTLHLFAKDDKVVNVKLVEPYLSSNPNAKSITYDGMDHTCCWNKIWLQTLEQVQKAQNSPLNPPVNE